MPPCRRDRLHWMDTEFTCKQGEHLSHFEDWSEVTLLQDPERLMVLDEGSEFHSTFMGSLESITGFRPSSRPPSHPARLSSASHQARQRWAANGYSPQVYHFEDSNLIWHNGVGRLPTISELERIQGLPAGYTTPPALGQPAYDIRR